MPWPQHWHQARLMGHRVRKYPASPYPRPSARVITEASRVRVSGSGQGFAARLCRGLVRTPLAGTGAYTLTTPNRCARVVVFSRPGHPKLVTSKTPAVTRTARVRVSAAQWGVGFLLESSHALAPTLAPGTAYGSQDKEIPRQPLPAAVRSCCHGGQQG